MFDPEVQLLGRVDSPGFFSQVACKRKEGAQENDVYPIFFTLSTKFKLLSVVALSRAANPAAWKSTKLSPMTNLTMQSLSEEMSDWSPHPFVVRA